MSTDITANRLEQARKAAGYATAREASEAMGIQYSTYAAHENGQRGLARAAERYAKFFRVSLDWLITGRGQPPKGVTPVPKQEDAGDSRVLDSPNARVRGKVDGAAVPIPLYGRAVGGVDGEFDMNGSLLGHILAPPSLAGHHGVYAVQVSGESMYPRYEDGETCIAVPEHRVKKGDYVIVQIQNEEEGPRLAFVKKFCRQNSEELVLEQFNPPKELRFPSNAVVSVHYIAISGNM